MSPDTELRVRKPIRWRLALCGCAAGIVWTLLSAISTRLLGGAFNAAVPGNKLFSPSAGLAAFLLIANLAGGVWVMWLYSAIRPRYGAGPRTAALAGFAWWLASSLADATWGSFGLVPVSALLPLSAVALPEMLVAAMVGSWLYKE